MNANDATAAYYDITSGYFKNEQVLKEEINLITLELEAHKSILDIGCGTGRHLLPLLEKGYTTTGIDSSKAMLKLLKNKNPSVTTVLTDFYDFQPDQKYDLCILFWNAFNEIALNDNQAKLFFNKCQKLLNDNGKFIINIDNAENVAVADLKFSFIINQPEKIEYYWEVSYYDEANNTTISTETIITLKEKLSTQIAQKWWYANELIAFAATYGFTCEIKHINSNNELYMIFMKNGK